MLPNFLIVGAQKAASSWLKVCLQEHPDVYIYEQGEIHFFNDHFEKGVAWYESHFDDWSGQKAVGEKSPIYLSHPDTPGRIKEVLGDVKLIVSLRHPVNRAYSEYWHILESGRIPANVEFRTFYQQRDQLHNRGNYIVHLKRYFEHFPRENILVLIFEEMKQHPQEAIAECLTFLNVDPQFTPDKLRSKVNKSKDVSVLQRQLRNIRLGMKSLPPNLQRPLINIGRSIFSFLPKQRNYVSLSEDTRQELLNDFLPGIKQLESLLGRELSIWYT